MGFSVGMVSLGCPKNQMDAELMMAKLQAAGIAIKADPALADVVIINTCGFIEEAKREAIDQILEFSTLKQEGRIKKIIVTGCMAERYRDEVMSELPECDAVTGLGANGDIVETVRRVMRDERVTSFPDKACWSLEGDRVQTTPSFFLFLRIGDGCDNCCTYCAIPHIRGRMRSRPMESLISEAEWLASRGVRELIVVAQDTTRYGIDLYGEMRLPDLLEQLCAIEGFRWIRLLYCYPECITERLLDVMAAHNDKLRYIDIPVQHASAPVLRAMNRTGDRASLTALMAHIRDRVPGITLRTTVMAGFPGETPDDFEELCDFVREVRFDRLGCFAYSAEEGTVAADMDGQIDEPEKRRRADLVMELQTSILEARGEALVGQTVDVLVEAYDRYAESWFGRTVSDAPDIDCKVFFPGAPDAFRPGDFVPVHVTELLDIDLIGEVASA